MSVLFLPHLYRIYISHKKRQSDPYVELESKESSPETMVLSEVRSFPEIGAQIASKAKNGSQCFPIKFSNVSFPHIHIQIKLLQEQQEVIFLYFLNEPRNGVGNCSKAGECR